LIALYVPDLQKINQAFIGMCILLKTHMRKERFCWSI